MPIQNKIWTINEVLNWSAQFLKSKGFENSRSDAEQLLMAALNIERISLYTNFERPLNDQERKIYREFIIRRSKNEPVQYISGFCFFMGLKLKVNNKVLIPRPDTEILVEKTIEIIKKNQLDQENIIIDVGTGSGAIAISVAKYIPKVKVIAVDISSSALDLAQENASANGVADKIQFISSDILESLIHLNLVGNIFIVFNPPYIDKQDYALLPAEVSVYEPQNALYGGVDGLKYYRLLVNQSSIFGHNLKGIFFEVGYNQAESVKEILKQKFCQPVFIDNDLGGIPRVVYTLLHN